MNFRTTLILLVLLAGGLVFLFIANHDSAPPKDAPAFDAKGQRLFDVESKAVDKLIVTPAQGDAVELVRVSDPTKPAGFGGDHWQITKPIQWRANSTEVERLLSALTDLRSRGRVQQTSSNQSAIGLQTPRYTVAADTKGGKTLKLAVGSRAALGSDVYVATGSQDAKTADLAPGTSLNELFDKTPAELVVALRYKALVTTSASDVKQLRLTTRDKVLSLEKQGEQWQITEPTKLKADNSAVSSLLFSLTGLTADEFLTEGSEAASAGEFDRPRLTARLSTAAPATQPDAKEDRTASVLTFGQFADIHKKKIYLKTTNPPAVATASFAEASLDTLTGASPLTLRDKDVLSIPQAEVSRIALTIDAPATQPTTASATGPATKPTPAIAHHHILIERRTADAAPSVRLKPIADVLSAQPRAARNSSPQTAPATSPATSRTFPSEAEVVTKLDADLQISLPPRPPQSPWVIVSEDGKPVDAKRADEGRMNDLLRSLEPLRAEKFVEKSPATQPSDVKAQYALKVTAVGPGGTPTRDYDLHIADRGADSTAVADYNPPPQPGQPATLTFELNRSILKNFEGDLTTKKPEPTPSATEDPHLPPGGGFRGFPGGGLPPG